MKTVTKALIKDTRFEAKQGDLVISKDTGNVYLIAEDKRLVCIHRNSGPNAIGTILPKAIISKVQPFYGSLTINTKL